VKRRRVRVGDRVEHRALGVGDVIRADGALVTVSFEAGVRRFPPTGASMFLCIVSGGAS